MQNISGYGNETQRQLIASPQQRQQAIPREEVELLFERFLVEAELAESTRATYRRTLRGFFAWREERGIADLDRSLILLCISDTKIYF
ncbi:hypothetical protein [Eggerthella lenta]|uniref:hypothetical protein n=1 Tax=Eggerthella lenta TaxID=84112 RepID=UPI0036F3F1DA